MIIDVIVPVILILIIGYIFGKYTDVDPAPISKLAVMILSPALIFSFLISTQLSSNEMFQIVVSVLIFTFVMIVITYIVIKFIKQKIYLSPALLTTVFPNTGNYGLPIIIFAYGEEAYGYAVIIVVINFILMYSLGVYFATLSGDSWKTGIKNILVLPTTYATIVAILVNILMIDIPETIFRPLKMIGDTMIPLALILLGIQLSRTKVAGYRLVTLTASLLKVFVAPFVIFAIVILLGIKGDLAKVIIIQNSMPTAVIMTLIATQYKAKEDLVANITFVGTILSFISISAILFVLEYLF